MGRVKKYVKKQVKRAGGFLKKRYAPGGRVNVGRIVKDVAILKNAINVEHKYRDEFHNPNVYQGVPYVTSLVSPIAQGTTALQRVGNSIKLNSFQLKARIDRAVALTAPANVNAIRVLLVLDKEPLVGTMTTNQLLQNTNTMALRNYEIAHTGRFRVLIDKTYVMDGINRNTINLSWYRSMETRVKYQQSDNAVIDNNLYLIVIADGLTGELTTQINTRLKYVDN